MAEPLKFIYNKQFFNQFTTDMLEVMPNFNKDAFIEKVFGDEWEVKELKQRMRHISTVLRMFLPNEFKDATIIIIKLVHLLVKTEQRKALEYMFLPDYLEHYGIDDFKTSCKSFEEITKYTSCEFAVRPFIIKYPSMMSQMMQWSKHDHYGVRRLSSEGCRPRLPWAMALSSFKNNPSSIIPILENLINDNSQYVQKSVANNLNDISKDNPAIVMKIAKKWIGKSKNIDWVLKHGCRTLLKQGDAGAMNLFGFGSINGIRIKNFHILTTELRIGGSLEFSFSIVNSNIKKAKLRLEYAIYYQKANASLSKKVFKISEKDYPPKGTNIKKKHSFRIITTRKFHSGLHQLSIIINGKEFDKLNFNLREELL